MFWWWGLKAEVNGQSLGAEGMEWGGDSLCGRLPVQVSKGCEGPWLELTWSVCALPPGAVISFPPLASP